MAGIPITLVGQTFTDPTGKTTFVGQAFTTGLQIGGGPMPGGPPLSIWGGGGVGNYPDAGFPGPQPGGPIGIWGGGGVGNYPDAGFPGPQPGGPVGIWGGPYFPPVVDAGFPAPQPPPPGAGPGQWRWVYSMRFGWVLDPGAGGKPQPPPGGGAAAEGAEAQQEPPP